MRRRSRLKVMAGLAGLIRPLAGFMAGAVATGLCGHLCASFITVLGGYAALNAAGYGGISFGGLSLTGIFIIVCIMAVLRGVLRYGEQTCNHYIAFKLLAIIRDKVFKALRKLCPAKLEGRDRGDLISVITSDIELLEVFYAHTVSPVAIAVLSGAVFCLFIGSFSPVLGLMALCAYLTVGLVIPVAVSRMSGDDGMKFREKSGLLSSYVLDSLRGLSEIIQFGSGRERLEKMGRKNDELSADEARMKRNAGINAALTNTAILFFDMAMLAVCAFFYANGAVGADGLLIPVLCLMSSYGPFVALASLGSTLQNTFAAGSRVLDILEEKPAVTDEMGHTPVTFDGAKAEGVTFSYDGEIPVLKDVYADIKKGSVVGITGRSGSGKSTLLKLFMRFWRVRRGSIKISGREVDHINTDDLRNMESYVTQETHLFRDSIKNNLKIAKLDASDEEMVMACKKASVHDFIMGLPQGYDTQVGELGDTLSGGERQRIGLARAFLHDGDLMLLDEPTSNLDSLNEAVILRSLHKERGNKTVLLVSHRKSTMKIADKIYSVENGRMS